MALHLNLTHEIRSQERKRSRDPLRVGLYIIVSIIVLCAAYYFYRQQEVSSIVAKANALSGDWESLSSRQQTAATQQEKLKGEMQERDHLINRVEGRFYWAPVLSKIMESVPPEVQITRLDGAAPAVKMGPRQCSLSLTGVAAGAEPRAVAEALRQRLRAKFSAVFTEVSSTFKTLEDGSDPVSLNGRPTPTASFSIQLSFTSTPPIADGKNTAAAH